MDELGEKMPKKAATKRAASTPRSKKDSEITLNDLQVAEIKMNNAIQGSIKGIKSPQAQKAATEFAELRRAWRAQEVEAGRRLAGPEVG